MDDKIAITVSDGANNTDFLRRLSAVLTEFGIDAICETNDVILVGYVIQCLQALKDRNRLQRFLEEGK